uniref:Uncharacterized protein n=1 Tax=Arundo donax TaxID=35708 RepID=A0A0A8ZT73_ARUDO
MLQEMVTQTSAFLSNFLRQLKLGHLDHRITWRKEIAMAVTSVIFVITRVFSTFSCNNENIQHLFFDCHFARSIWHSLNCSRH